MKRRVRGSAVVAVAALAGAVIGGRAWGGAIAAPTRTVAVAAPSGPTNADRRKPPPEHHPAAVPAPVIGTNPFTLSATQPVTGGSPTYDPCPAQALTLAGEAPSLAQRVSIPAVPAVALTGAAARFNPGPGEVPTSYDGTVLRPSDTGRHGGLRPAVVLLHGIGGEQCQMWWLARYLAGAGYVALTLTSPTPPEHDASYGVAIDAARSAVDLLANPLENPYWASTDPADVSLAGWSEGSVAASVVQGLPDMAAVRAIVALDDLRGSFLGDSGAPMTFCSPPVEGEVTPRVPALGFASDTPCDVEPTDSNSDLKLSGFNRWRQAGVPAVELPLAGYGHFDFETAGPKLDPVGALTLAWLDTWSGVRPAALGAFSACHLDGGLPAAGTLSRTFHAGAYLPSEGIGTANWGQDLAGRCGAAPGVVGTTPLR